MPPNPQFFYYLYDTATPVDGHHPAWRRPLPLSRHLTGERNRNSISHGEYFLAIRRFLEDNECGLMAAALERRLLKKVKAADIGAIGICLAKHGEFYHPARLDVSVGRQSAVFVLNVAVSDAGTRTIPEEHRNLKRLNAEYSLAFVPRVYDCGQIEIAGRHTIALLLADWFEGYHEFHISAALSRRAGNIHVWGEGAKRSILSTAQQAEIYRQAARILTYYYNVESFEQIFAWHHAAGDFVVRVENTAVDLKLIAVRRYAPLIQHRGQLATDGAGPEVMLQALLLFFLGLSIRMRLDRIDGVGDIVWADDFAVAATLEGFFEGLALKPPIPGLPDTVVRCFAYFLSVCSEEDIHDLCRSVADTFDRRAPETIITRQNLDEHIVSLTRSIEQFLPPC